MGAPAATEPLPRSAEAAPPSAPTLAELQEEAWESMSAAAILLLGGANVIMQLARLPVGHGVAKSKVDSGNLHKRPIKRTRTTLSYLMIAMFGTEDERAAYRREVNRSHRPVHSEPGDDVSYNAFDKDLQLWVAACIYVGSEQAAELFVPDRLDVDDATAEARYRYGSRMATTLQVPEEMWPADREAFDRYWAEGIEQIEMDELTRGYLREFARLDFLPTLLAKLFGPLHEFIAAGYLPPRFREELGLDWSKRKQRWHDRITKPQIALGRFLPGPLRRFPLNFYLRDTRRRIRTGKPIV